MREEIPPVTARQKKRFLLRLDAHLFGELERWAGEDLRSVNAQIEYLLAEVVRSTGRNAAGKGRLRSGFGRPHTRPGKSPV